MLDALLAAIAVATAAALLRPALRRSATWRATVTPLASIIGSGFLVVGPLLVHATGALAPLAMAGILALAWSVGAVIRFNIRAAEPTLEARAGARGLVALERLSDLFLALAYLVSVAFYVRLLASFVLRAADLRDETLADALTTAVLASIGALGAARGLRGLEWLEEAAVDVKLAIIAALLAGLAWHDVAAPGPGLGPLPAPGADTGHTLRVLAGLLLVVQGFETSRYLGHAYPAGLRIRTMRLAQIVAGGIYLAFIVLGLPLLAELGERADETAIIDVAARIAGVLPPLLVLAAAMSQLSAAVADTAGGGGLVREVTRARVPERVGYVLVTGIAIALVWAADVLELIALASRAFALYYLAQCLVALAANRGRAPGWRRALRALGCAALAAVLAAVVVLAVPAG